MNKSAISNLFSSQTITPASWLTIVFSLVLAFAVGLFIAFVYRKNYRGVMYSNNFVLTLVMMTLITCPVVMCIKESIQLSMGMVGALSIVRFRTAVKEPLDTAYMFWALTMGILLGAGQFFLTAVTVVGIAILLTVLVRIQSGKLNSYLLVVRGALGALDSSKLEKMLADKKRIRRSKLRMRSLNGGEEELTYELSLKSTQLTQLVEAVHALPGVESVNLVSYSGELLG